MPEEAVGLENAEGGKVRGLLPRKRRINLAKVTRTRFPWAQLLLSVVGVVVACVLFVRYAVIARFDALHVAEERLAAAQKDFDDVQEVLNDYYESRDVYVHITWSDMTSQEIEMVNPSDVADLLERVIFPVSPLNAWSLSGNAMTLTIRAATLEDVNEMARRLREEPMIEYCAIRSGGRTASGEDGAGGVSSELTIRFKSADNRNTGGISVDALQTGG